MTPVKIILTTLMSPQLKSYITGFILSILFTIVVFSLVMENLLTGNALITTLILLALLQAFVQLTFFLHLGRGSRWNLPIFATTVSVVFVLVIGSLWIMNHLNYNMTPQQMTDYMMNSENIFK